MNCGFITIQEVVSTSLMKNSLVLSASPFTIAPITLIGFQDSLRATVSRCTPPLLIECENRQSVRARFYVTECKSDPVTLGLTTLSAMGLIAKLPVNFPGQSAPLASAFKLEDALEQAGHLVDLQPDEDEKANELHIRDRIKTLLDQNATLTGFCNLPEGIVELKLKDATPINKRPYRIPQSLVSSLEQQRDLWLAQGRIARLDEPSSWNLPLVPAVKPADEPGKPVRIRWCLDGRSLNANLMDDTFPIPLVSELLVKLRGKRIFSQIDLSDAYMQLLLSADSRKIVVVTILGVQYVFYGAVYGIAPIAAALNRVTQSVVEGQNAAASYFDNIIVASDDLDSHVQDLTELFVRLNSANLQVKASKLWLGRKKMRAFGHVVSAAGIAVDPAKVQEVLQWPFPTTAAQVRSFLGIVSFLRSHIKHCSSLTAPFERLKSNEEQWAQAGCGRYSYTSRL